jgi:hypothetical protein
LTAALERVYDVELKRVGNVVPFTKPSLPIGVGKVEMMVVAARVKIS